MYQSGRWQKYKYAVAALIAIMVFCGFLFSYVDVAISASAPATKALNNIAVSPSTATYELSEAPPLVSFSTGSYRLNFGEGVIEVCNNAYTNVTVTLTVSAIVGCYDGLDNRYTNYDLGSVVISNVRLAGLEVDNIQVTLNDTTPIANWTERPSGLWNYTCSVQASIPVNYLFWQTTVGDKTFDFNGLAIVS